MGVGHFGRLVIGDKKAAEEAELVSVGAHHFGPLVVDYPGADKTTDKHVHGSRVTDVPVEAQMGSAAPDRAPPMPDFNPSALLAVKTSDAKDLIADQGDIRVLRVWRSKEADNPEYEGGRRGVLGALDKRIGELTD